MPDNDKPRSEAANPNPSRTSAASATPGSLPPEPVEDRPGVSRVRPEDYPRDQRARLGAGEENRGRRATKGSGPASGSGAGAGGKGNPEDYDSDPQGGGGDGPPVADDGPKTGADAPAGGSR